MKIAIDFDGTICEHVFPEIGQEVPLAIEWIRTWKSAGAQIILWTMRSDAPLMAALYWLQTKGIQFDAINEGIGDRAWTTSQKAHANIYVDDAAFGCPLVSVPSKRPYVDWGVVGPVILGMIENEKQQILAMAS
jgi:hypothetical protein